MDEERRKSGRRFSDEDLKTLAKEIHELQSSGGHVCRFSYTTPEDLTIVIAFVKQLMLIMDDSKRVVRKTVLVGLIWAFGAVLTAGTVVTVQKMMKP